MTPATEYKPSKMPAKVFTLAEIKGRVDDVYRQHAADDIERNQVVRIGLGIFEEMRWLIGEVEKNQPSDDQPRSEKKAKAA